MAIRGLNFENIFPHSREFDQGGGSERTGQATVVVSQDGTGDTDSIQEGINMLPSDGGVVFIKEGTYIITEQINITKSNVAIQGTGYGTKIETNTAGIKLIKCVGADYTTIRDIQVDGNNVSAAAIWLENSSNCIIEGCFIHNANNAVYQWENAGNSNDNTILNNKLDTFTVSAIELNLGGDRSIIVGNSITGAGNYGISIAAANYCSIIGNNITNSTNSGILGAIGYTTITGNVCDGNGTYGIEIDAGDKNIISSNSLYNNTTAAYLDSGTNTQIGHNVTA